MLQKEIYNMKLFLRLDRICPVLVFHERFCSIVKPDWFYGGRLTINFSLSCIMPVLKIINENVKGYVHKSEAVFWTLEK